MERLVLVRVVSESAEGTQEDAEQLVGELLHVAETALAIQGSKLLAADGVEVSVVSKGNDK